MASELEKIIVTMEANNAALLKKIEQNNKSLNAFKGKTEKALSKVDQAFVRTGNVAAASGKRIGRSFKGAAGQLGFQVQDIAVQLAAGQNAMLVFGQQGSQIASIFGPGGAVVGALIAVTSALGGALVPKLFEAENAAEELDKAFKRLSETLKQNENGIFEYTKEFKALAKLDPSVAEVRILANQNEALEASRTAVKKLKDELGDISGLSNKFDLPIQDLGEMVRILNKPLVTKEDLFQLQGILNRLALSGKAISPAFIQLTDDVNSSIMSIKSLDRQMEALKSKSFQFDSIGDLSKITGDRVKLIKKSFAASSAELNDFIKDMDKLAKLDEAFNKRVSGALNQAFPQDARIGKLREQILDLNVALEQAFNAGDTEKVKQYGAAIAELEGQISNIANKSLRDALNQAFPDEAKIRGLREQILTLKVALEEAFAEGRVDDVKKYEKAVAELEKQVNKVGSELTKWQEEALKNLQGSFGDFFEDMDAGFDGLADTFLKMLNRMIADAASAQLMKALFGDDGSGGFLGGAGGTVGTVLNGLLGFDGGGYTGNQPRSGGLDGKGGFLAMMHPQEIVTDLHGSARGSSDTSENPLNVAVVYDTESVLEIMRSPAGRKIVVENSRKDAREINRNLSRI